MASALNETEIEELAQLYFGWLCLICFKDSFIVTSSSSSFCRTATQKTQRSIILPLWPGSLELSSAAQKVKFGFGGRKIASGWGPEKSPEPLFYLVQTVPPAASWTGYSPLSLTHTLRLLKEDCFFFTLGSGSIYAWPHMYHRVSTCFNASYLLILWLLSLHQAHLFNSII